MKNCCLSLGCLFLIVLLSCNDSTRSSRNVTNEENAFQYVDLVEPLVDANNGRWFFFNTASRPFGMVNLIPDTESGGDWGGGYHYYQDSISGFSHIHAWQLGGVAVIPVTVDQKNEKSIFTKYRSHFSHETEKVEVGYQSLHLDKYNVTAEITSTKRVGFHRYTYGSDTRKAILFNLNGELGPCMISDGVLIQTGDRELSGSLVNRATRRREKPCSVFFKVCFNAKIADIKRDDITGNYLVFFNSVRRNKLLMKVAVSYTSVENAAYNMQAELPGWDFDSVVLDSKHEWNDLLGRIHIEGGTLEQRRRFYTDLFHSLLGRRVISDANGAYPDNTGDTFMVKRIPLDANGKPEYDHYNSDAFWGAQWTLNTLWGLAYPEMMSEFINSFLLYYMDGGLIPRGPSGGNYTYVMTGSSFTPFIVSAYQKGIRDFDVARAYEGSVKNHLPGGIMERAGYEFKTALGGGLRYYDKIGYVPWPIPEGNFGFHQDGASLTCEYAYQDWTLAQFAKSLGKTDDYNYFMKRSSNYKNVYDSNVGWMRPKDVKGKWKTPFDPFDPAGFNESNSYQSTWFVPHDLEGLASLMGGNEKTVKKLNKLFESAEKSRFTSFDPFAVKRKTQSLSQPKAKPKNEFITINYGNQPSMQTAFIFNYLGQPWLTQYWSRTVVKEVYEGISPDDGYCGDEDQGLMGSLSVLMKMGLFSMDGGCGVDPVYELGSPCFDRIVISLNNDYYPGKEVVIDVKNNSPDHVYIQSAKLNDKTINDFIIKHSDLIKGAKLELVMDAEPNKAFGINYAKHN